MISKDELAYFDPAITRVDVDNFQGDKYITLSLEFNTAVLTFKKAELERLLKEIE